MRGVSHAPAMFLARSCVVSPTLQRCFSLALFSGFLPRSSDVSPSLFFRGLSPAPASYVSPTLQRAMSLARSCDVLQPPSMIFIQSSMFFINSSIFVSHSWMFCSYNPMSCIAFAMSIRLLQRCFAHGLHDIKNDIMHDSSDVLRILQRCQATMAWMTCIHSAMFYMIPSIFFVHSSMSAIYSAMSRTISSMFCVPIVKAM